MKINRPVDLDNELQSLYSSDIGDCPFGVFFSLLHRDI